MKFNKYKLYEIAVQSPHIHLDWLQNWYQQLRGEAPHHLREDFCGTFQVCCEWVKRDPQNTALGIDLDPEPLSYGTTHHLKRLSPHQQKRVKLLKQNVLKPTSPVKDAIMACNFSFFIFKERKTLLKYFQACHHSLSTRGILFLEMAGGPGMISRSKEQKTIVSGGKKYLYIWDQKKFDPITHDAFYAIHFAGPEKKSYRNVFTYDWRIWGIPEVKDLLKEAGFKKCQVYWETSHRGKGTGEYAVSKKGDNSYAWIAYLIGVR